VAEAAVVAVPHPKWQERPLALLVLKNGATVGEEELRTMLAKTFAKWQLPENFVFVPDLPHTSTGKLKKSELRQRYRNWAPQIDVIGKCNPPPATAELKINTWISNDAGNLDETHA
jgi:fatty-acyl-CoA synthase